MARLASFMPDSMNISRDDVKELVSLQFGQGGDDVELIFHRSTIAQIFDEAMQQGRFERPAPIEPAHLKSAMTVEGHAVGRLTNGDVCLTVHIRTDDGVRDLPMAMPPEEAVKLANLLTGYASGT